MTASGDPRQTKTPRIVAIIVNYNTAQVIIDHFDALAAECAVFPHSQIIIVDNASPNGDGARLLAFAADEKRRQILRVIASPTNTGFAKGNNIALREALAAETPPEFIYLLNPDAYVRPGALTALADFLNANPKAGVVGSRLEYPDGSPQVSAFRFFSVESEFETAARTGFVSALFKHKRVAPPQRDETRAVDWVCGASVLIRREVFDDVGLFDEAYFLYYEETDFMLQAARKGWETWYAPASRAVHLVGQSTGVVDGNTRAKVPPDYWFDSRAHYLRKNHGALYAAAADAAWLAGSAMYLFRAALTGRKDSPLPAMRSFLRGMARTRSRALKEAR